MLFFSVHLRPPRFTLFPYTTLFRSLTFDWTCPEDLRDQQPLIGGETCHFTYGDLQAEMDLINRAYIDVMADGDADGRAFTFPIPTYNITKDFDWDSQNTEALFARSEERRVGKEGKTRWLH